MTAPSRLAVLAASVLLAGCAGTPPDSTESFWPYAAGDTLVLAAAASGTASTLWYADTTLGATRWLQRWEDNGDVRLERLDAKSELVMHSFAFRDSLRLIYDRPVRLLPSRLAPGVVLRDSVEFEAAGRAPVVGRGRQWVEVAVGAWESVETPLGSRRALAVREDVRRIYANGEYKGYEITSWLVPDVGLVRAEGALVWWDESGQETRRVPIGAALAEGVVGGERIGRSSR